VPGKDIIVIGGSAGAIEPIRTLLRNLPAEFAGSLFIVIHTSPNSPGIMHAIFDAAGPLKATTAVNGEKIAPGRVYVAAVDHHLVIEPGKVRLTRGPKENRFRPAIDPLFRSAAQTYGPRVVGIVFSGGLDDGTSGLWTVKQLGGTAIVQDPQEALAPSMPQSAMQHVRADHVVGAEEIAPLLVRLVSTPADLQEGDRAVPEDINIEVEIANADSAMEAGVLKLGSPSNYGCPECHGVLLEMKERAPLRFRCHTGHAYTLESLMSEMDEVIEESLWSAIRALEERAMLLRQAGTHAAHGGSGDFRARADEAQRRAEVVREVVFADTARMNGQTAG
jgi:two-component system chemotaxis response regulator CheB